ncbi:MAG: ATP-binding cassette domain-containing protein [Lachnospiraceae bacterium]|nr:ATP-binding cassette domain-containing protein [Lachnospiraceae bacterium]
MNNIIEIKNLKKYFAVPQGTLHAVDDVTLSIPEGKTLGVVGESGCGKSTLGRTIIRLLEPTSGDVYYNGENIISKSKAEVKKLRRDLQMIFQDPYESLDPRMNVSRLITEPLIINKLYTGNGEREKVVSEMLELVGISEKLKGSYPHELDGGTRQRVGIARALALDPKFIVCDEPVSALDVSIQAQVINLLQRLQESKNLTYMFITHNLSVARHISDIICVMYLGQVIELAERYELFSNTLHPYSQALLSAIPVPSTHNRRTRIILKSELTSPLNPKPGCRFAPRCIHAKPECFEVTPELKDVGNNHKVACHLV